MTIEIHPIFYTAGGGALVGIVAKWALEKTFRIAEQLLLKFNEIDSKMSSVITRIECHEKEIAFLRAQYGDYKFPKQAS